MIVELKNDEKIYDVTKIYSDPIFEDEYRLEINYKLTNLVNIKKEDFVGVAVEGAELRRR